MYILNTKVYTYVKKDWVQVRTQLLSTFDLGRTAPGK